MVKQQFIRFYIQCISPGFHFVGIEEETPIPIQNPGCFIPCTTYDFMNVLDTCWECSQRKWFDRVTFL